MAVGSGLMGILVEILEKKMSADFDVCVIGSGAPIAYELSKAGYNVVVLE